MHEYHIVEDIIKVIIAKATASSAKKVLKVSLVMGAASGLEESSVRMYFENIAEGTILEGAELVILNQSTQLKCNSCDMVFDYKKGEFNCPRCGKLAGVKRGNQEFYIESIEIES